MRSMMPRYDERTESFIIRIWIEPRELSGAPLVWRGEIEHVTSHRRHFFNQLQMIADLIQPYLASMGISPHLPPSED